MNPTLMRKWGVITKEKLNGVDKTNPEEEESHLIMDKIPSHNPNLQAPLDLYLHTMRVYNQKMSLIVVPSV